MNSIRAIISSVSTIKTPDSEHEFTHQQTNKKNLFYQTTFQCKISTAAAADPLEKQADDMADKVITMEMLQPINFSLAENSVRNWELSDGDLPAWGFN